MIDAFLWRENCWGGHIYMGKIWGNNICRMVTNFEITVLEVPKLQKTIPQNCELPATLCPSVA